MQVRAPPVRRRAPADAARDRLEGHLPEALLDRVPRSWQRLGDVLLVKPEPALGGHEALVYGALAEVLGARSVLAYEGAAGELREPVTRLLWGDPDTETVHRESGLAFHLDPARVLFSAGNVHERHRLVGVVRRDERVVDLFAGIGYFALPLAHAGARVWACEKNAISAAYLRRNVEANALGDRVAVLEGDCRDVAPVGVADRVLMGYFPGTQMFLPHALRALRSGRGTIHYHTTAGEPNSIARAWSALQAELGRDAPEARLVGARRVKSYAPGVTHVVLDVEVRA